MYLFLRQHTVVILCLLNHFHCDLLETSVHVIFTVDFSGQGVVFRVYQSNFSKTSLMKDCVVPSVVQLSWSFGNLVFALRSAQHLELLYNAGMWPRCLCCISTSSGRLEGQLCKLMTRSSEHWVQLLSAVPGDSKVSCQLMTSHSDIGASPRTHSLVKSIFGSIFLKNLLWCALSLNKNLFPYKFTYSFSMHWSSWVK